ncbi:MAG: ATP-binding protein [Pyrinomonadaceae bacterium]|nr:ATP-binding protein [Pyrinomonadaceae bacterium]
MSDSDISTPPASSFILRYGLAVSSVAAALFITYLLRPDALVSPIFFLAIILSAWFGGIGPGLVAALLATMAIAYFLHPQHSLRFADVPHLFVFFVSALLVSSWSATRKRAQNLLQQARDELEIKVQERTADLRQTNQQLQAEIAERSRVEEALREKAGLLDLTHDTVFVRDMNDVIRYWNRGAEELYGWKQAEAIGQVTHQLTQTMFPEQLKKINDELLNTGRWEGELEHTRRDGSKVRVASRWSLQRDEQGRPTAILETNNDITERKEAEDALQKTQAELMHVTRVTTMGELTASIAHEVNQPLAAVVTNGNAGLRWLAIQPPNLLEVRQAVERIINDGNRASAIIGRIRALVKKAPVRKDLVDINDVIHEVIALTGNELQRNRVSLVTQLSDALPLVLGDRIQLQQVILNLIINGVEAMSLLEEGPRELLIKAAKDDSNDLLVAVRDSGIGIQSANLEQLFDAFYTTKTDGMGMGLAICRSIIETHGGRLWATANSPCGAVFQFTLPATDSRVS